MADEKEEKALGVEIGDARIYGTLTVRERVLETSARTISIDNIASITVGSVKHPRNVVRLLLAGLPMFFAISALRYSYDFGVSRNWQITAFGFVLLAVSAYLFVTWYRSGWTEHFLIVSSNDGARSLFRSQGIETLQEVRRLLTEKINSGNEAATYTINFKEARIETLHAGGLSGRNVVVGSNNHVAVDSPGARVGSHGDDIRVSQSPGAQIGHGNVSAGNTITQKIDYSRFVAPITQMRDHYARYPEAADTTAKLDELLRLMQSGTPDAQSKSRLRTIAGDIGKLLDSYPAFVQLFRDIVGLAT